MFHFIAFFILANLILLSWVIHSFDGCSQGAQAKGGLINGSLCLGLLRSMSGYDMFWFVPRECSKYLIPASTVYFQEHIHLHPVCNPKWKLLRKGMGHQCSKQLSVRCNGLKFKLMCLVLHKGVLNRTSETTRPFNFKIVFVDGCIDLN